MPATLDNPKKRSVDFKLSSLICSRTGGGMQSRSKLLASASAACFAGLGFSAASAQDAGRAPSNEDLYKMIRGLQADHEVLVGLKAEQERLKKENVRLKSEAARAAAELAATRKALALATKQSPPANAAYSGTVAPGSQPPYEPEAGFLPPSRRRRQSLLPWPIPVNCPRFPASTARSRRPAAPSKIE